MDDEVISPYTDPQKLVLDQNCGTYLVDSSFKNKPKLQCLTIHV